jgi:hypothetical protein
MVATVPSIFLLFVLSLAPECSVRATKSELKDLGDAEPIA